MQLPTFLVFLLATVIATDAWRDNTRRSKSKKNGFNRRKCKLMCGSFSRHLDTNIFLKEKVLNDHSPENVVREYERFCAMRRPICDPFDTHFRDYLDEFHDAVKGKQDINKVCGSARICEKIRKGKSKPTEGKSWSGLKTCKICRTVTKLLSAAIANGNDSIVDAKKLAVQACEKYMKDKTRINKCLELVDELIKMEEALAGKLEHMHLCRGLGMCGNDTEELKKECLDGLRPRSPWGTAMSVVRGMGGIFLSGKSLNGAIYEAVKNTFWSQVQECLSVVKERMMAPKSRVTRSVDQPHCGVCDKMATHAKTLLMGSGKRMGGLSRHLKSLCSSVQSSSSKKICKFVYSFANTTQSMVDSVMPSHLCESFSCGKPDHKKENRWNDNNQCELCQTISGFVVKNIHELGDVTSYIINVINDLCVNIDSKRTEKACHFVAKALNNIIKDMEKQFTDNHICKEMGVCPKTSG